MEGLLSTGPTPSSLNAFRELLGEVFLLAQDDLKSAVLNDFYKTYCLCVTPPPIFFETEKIL